MVFTGGFLWLILYWIPRKKLQLTHQIVHLSEAESILVQVGLIKRQLLYKNGPNTSSFCLFSSFSHYNFNNTNWKKCRWCVWDLNLGQQDCRCRRIHWATAAPQKENFYRSLILDRLSRANLMSRRLDLLHTYLHNLNNRVIVVVSVMCQNFVVILEQDMTVLGYKFSYESSPNNFTAIDFSLWGFVEKHKYGKN